MMGLRPLGEGASNTEADDVTNNPLTGRQYGGWGNGASYKFYNNTLSVQQLVGDKDTGVIEMDPTAAGALMTSQMKTGLRRPPPAATFGNVKKTAKCGLAPGAIRSSTFVFKRVMYFNKFMEHWVDVLRSSTTGSRFKLGRFQMFAFEKTCRTGISTNQISVGYEINTTYRCMFKNKLAICIPDQVIG